LCQSGNINRFGSVVRQRILLEGSQAGTNPAAADFCNGKVLPCGLGPEATPIIDGEKNGDLFLE
jgi:hypothetical protein